uniref:Uncharacterized protein n=1 Tax=Arundo donax TaxID=35708 RepID=A0A0A8ZN01_ARUDO
MRPVMCSCKNYSIAKKCLWLHALIFWLHALAAMRLVMCCSTACADVVAKNSNANATEWYFFAATNWMSENLLDV